MRNLTALRCRLGSHSPIAPGVWNGGYCFTQCSRCGRDMVRSLFGEWHVPQDYRVVWKPTGASPLVEDATVKARPAEPTPTETEKEAPRRRADPFDFGDFDA